MEAVRTTLLTSIMAPHRIALFNAMAEMPEIDLTVIYLARTDPSRRWTTAEGEMRYRHGVLRERLRLTRGDSFLHLTSGLVTQLRRSRPEVIVGGGWDQLAYQEAYALRSTLHTRFLWWVESNVRDRRPDTGVLRGLKRRFIRGVDGVVVPGQASLDYVQQLGAQPHRTWVAPNAVDNDFFASRSHGRTGRAGPTRFIFVGRLTSSKGLACLLDSWSRVHGDVELVLAGTGPLEALAHARVASADMPPVRFLGHLDREGLAAAYAEADVFVFPSVSDPWGLVINEAMAAGLPVIATSAPGAVDDLVHHNDNGYVVPPFDPGGLTGAMQALADDPALRARMGARSRERISQSTPDDWAEGMRHAVLSVARSRVGA
jgi:glycosyltransferase involved in cell wall biosynthesis